MLARLIDSDKEKEVILLYSEGKEKYVWNTGDPLVLPCPLNKVNRKEQQHDSGRTRSFRNQGLGHYSK